MYLLDNQDHVMFLAVDYIFARFRPFNFIMNSMKSFIKFHNLLHISVHEIKVEGSHRIYLGKPLKDLLKHVTNRDKTVSMEHFNGEGYRETRDFIIFDLNTADYAVESCRGFLKDRIFVSYITYNINFPSISATEYLS